MKLALFFVFGFAVALASGLLLMKAGNAAEPVDAFVMPVPATPAGTSAPILPPGTYHAVRSDGVRLSGWVHSPDTSRFSMQKRVPSLPPKAIMPQRDPQLRFVPVTPQFPTLARPAK